MRKKVIKVIMKYIDKKKKLTNEEKEIVIYGLESIYILITKLIVILLVALLLNILKAALIFLALFNIIRLFAFGIHATKSYICLITSLIVFIGFPFIAKNITISNNLIIIFGIILTLLIFIYSPADTIKRPIISKKRRIFFKITSTIISITYVILAYYINSSFISNCLIFSLLLETIFISPITYKLFKLPYNNYLNYKRKEDLICS